MRKSKKSKLSFILEQSCKSVSFFSKKMLPTTKDIKKQNFLITEKHQELSL